MQSATRHDPDKVIFNYSTYDLSDGEKNVLAKGLNFAIPPKKLNYADYFTPFELLFRDVKKLSLDGNILERIKVDIKKTCYSSFDNYNFDNELNITQEELAILKKLGDRDDLIIQKADKGNNVVILNKIDYINRMREILSNSSKFKKINVNP